jgi:large subunit ribosomal protein L11
MVTIKLLVEGGKMTPGPAVAQQLGPMGLNLGQIINDVNTKTSDFKGMNVPVNLDVDPDTKEYTIKVMSPPVSELLKKELKIDKASGERLKNTVGNLAFERIIFVAKQKHENMLSNTLTDSIKSVLGTCQAMGIIVDSKEIKQIQADLKEGKYDAMIKAEKIEVDAEKQKELNDHFKGIKSKEDAASKAAAEAAEDKKEKTKEEPAA